MYQITQNFLTGIPTIPYRNGVGNYEGCLMHATDSWEDSVSSERNYEQNNWQNAFVHFFVDDTTILQVADTKYIAWGAGPKANPRFVHLELCQTKDPNRFKAAYANWVWLAAYILFQKGLGVAVAQSDGTGTLWRHKDVTNFLGGTTHTDPDDYLSFHGKTWDNVVNDVTYLYNSMTQPQANPNQWKLDAIALAKSRGFFNSDHVPGEPVTIEVMAGTMNNLYKKLGGK